MSRIIEYKGNFFYLIFCQSAISFDNLKNSANQLVSEVESKVFFPCV